jgi:two-component system, OmpR family, sensor kinase
MSVLARSDSGAGASDYSTQAERRDDSGVVKALADLNSELGNTQRQLARRNAELAAAIADKNQLLGMAAHDLRNPLGIIAGVADLLSEQLNDSSLEAENRDLLSRVARSAEYMQSLIDEILDYTMVEAGRLDLQMDSADLAELIRQNLRFNTMLAAKKGINLHFDCDQALPPLRFDSRRIQQVLDNLISNALKFSSSGTTVTVSLHADGKQATVAVADQGRGIAADQIENLFKPYRRSRTGGTANEKRFGLGLAIVRRIVAAHGGRIWVESEPGRGSTFYVSLPITMI